MIFAFLYLYYVWTGTISIKVDLLNSTYEIQISLVSKENFDSNTNNTFGDMVFYLTWINFINQLYADICTLNY